MEYFKGDDLELKMISCGAEILDNLSLQKDLFFDGAYDTSVLGDLIYLTGRSPLSNAITQNIFRSAFQTIFEAFIECGSFESYLTVFRKIFGSSVGVTFTIPGPGKLTIAITAAGLEESIFSLRVISSNTYRYYNCITQDSVDTVVFQTIIGFQSQYELEHMLNEMVPGGIFTSITLTLG